MVVYDGDNLASAVTLIVGESNDPGGRAIQTGNSGKRVTLADGYPIPASSTFSSNSSWSISLWARRRDSDTQMSNAGVVSKLQGLRGYRLARFQKTLTFSLFTDGDTVPMSGFSQYYTETTVTLPVTFVIKEWFHFVFY